MQHSPRFLNYTTDRVRRHQRLTVAEESISPARSDQQRRRNTGAARQAKRRGRSRRDGVPPAYGLDRLPIGRRFASQAIMDWTDPGLGSHVVCPVL